MRSGWPGLLRATATSPTSSRSSSVRSTELRSNEVTADAPARKGPARVPVRSTVPGERATLRGAQTTEPLGRVPRHVWDHPARHAAIKECGTVALFFLLPCSPMDLAFWSASKQHDTAE